MNPLLKKHFGNFKQRFDISIPENISDREKILHESKAFEKFVNHIIFSLDYPETFTADINLLNYISIGGGHDTGIDGLGIMVNEILVRSEEDIKLILQEKNKRIEYDYIFVQSKMQSNFDASEFNTFAIGIEHFLLKEPKLPENDRVKEFRKIKDLLDSDEVNKRIKRNPNINLYYVSTGNPPTDQHFLATRDLIEKKFKESDYYFNEVNVRLIDGLTLIGFCDELDNNFQVRINILDTLPLLVGTNEDIKKAHVFTCTAKEYLKILTKEDGSLRKHLFNDNVRDYLGSKEGSVNNEIEKSITQSPEMFLLCNNGVTIVCSDFNPIKDKLVQVDNPQIVNGCQTSTSIFKQRENPNIENVKLLVRLICTENSIISNKIVRGTNKQNQVLEEAFEATLPFHQDNLEPFFSAIDIGPRLYYERRAKQYSDSTIKKTQIVNLRILAQSFTAMFLNSPHDSYRHEKIILENYGGEIWKRKIFRDEHSEYPYYAAAAVWYMFEKYVYREEYKGIETYKGHLYLIFRETLGEDVPRLTKGNKIETYCKKLIDLTKEPEFEKRFKLSVSIFQEARDKWIKKGNSQFGIKDIKTFTELLLSISRKKFFSKKTFDKETDRKYKGKILRIVFKENLWHCFIECNDLQENLYFDSRGYKGELKKLKPTVDVEFSIMETKSGRLSAKDVTVISSPASSPTTAKSAPAR